MSDGFSYTYVPGFLHGTDCVVGVELRKRLKPYGVDVEIIDAMNGLTRFDCSISSGVTALEAVYEKCKKPLYLLGASMGGFIALVYTAKYPQNVDRLVLLNSALNMKSTWLNILQMYHPDVSGEESMRKWKQEGQLMFQGVQMTKPEPVSYNYVVDSMTHPAYPLVDVPVLSIAGVHDVIIPHANHHEWKKRQINPEKVTSIEFNEGHGPFSEASWETIVSSIVKYSS
eukprot:g2548.t1